MSRYEEVRAAWIKIPARKQYGPDYARERVVAREFPPVSLLYNEFEIMQQIVFSENDYQNAQGFPFEIYKVPEGHVYIVDTAFLQWQYIAQLGNGVVDAQIEVRDQNNIRVGYLVHTQKGFTALDPTESACNDPAIFVYPAGYIVPTGHSIWLNAGSDEFYFDFIVHGYLAKPLRQYETFYNGGNQGYPTV